VSARALVAAALLSLVALSGADAQKKEKEIKRPKLDAAADTNDALSYYQFGVVQLRRDADMAERSFYWATRLAPSWADPYYGRWAASVLLTRGRPSKKDRAHADSLDEAAAMRNPFLFRRLDRMVVEEIVSRVADPEDVGSIMFEYTRNTGDPVNDAFQAYQSSKFADAARLYAQAIARNAKSGKRPWLHEDRALAFYQLQQFDSAATELDAFLAAMRAREDTSLDRGYLSKAFAEYQLGTIHLLRGDTAAARAAFGRALSEDLTYAPAHTALAGIATGSNDMATALAESEAATQTHDGDAVLHYTYARMLLAASRADDAERELKRAQVLEPYYALPYYLLGRLYDGSSMDEEATVQYEAFLARGARQLQEYDWTRTRLAAMKAAAVAPSTPAKGG
jgi:hypothetical protein